MNFIVAITEKQFIGKLDGANIYCVKGIELYPFLQQEYGKKIGQYIDGLKRLFS